MVFYFQKIVIFSYAVLFINRENEVLKVQLKKYVGAVQMLRREGQAVEGKDKGKKKKKKSMHRILPLRQNLLEA